MNKYFVITIENNRRSFIDKIYPTLGMTSKYLSLIPEYGNQYLRDITIFYYKGQYINSKEDLINLLKESDYKDYAFDYLPKDEKEELLNAIT